MNQRQRKKLRRNLYCDLINDVALEISLDSYWRGVIFAAGYNSPIEFGFYDSERLPEYIKNKIICNKLKFTVQKVSSCNKKFDDGLVIFKFQSAEFKDIVDYSGNNPNVI